MASWCLSVSASASASSVVSVADHPRFGAPHRRTTARFRAPSTNLPPMGVVCMAPEEEKMTRRSPLDFPIEWERPKPGRRPDIFPQFSPMKTPLPSPLPADPPEEDEEEEENKEEEEDPEKEENPDQPEKGTRINVRVKLCLRRKSGQMFKTRPAEIVLPAH